MLFRIILAAARDVSAIQAKGEYLSAALEAYGNEYIVSAVKQRPEHE